MIVGKVACSRASVFGLRSANRVTNSETGLSCATAGSRVAARRRTRQRAIAWRVVSCLRPSRQGDRSSASRPCARGTRCAAAWHIAAWRWSPARWRSPVDPAIEPVRDFRHADGLHCRQRRIEPEGPQGLDLGHGAAFHHRRKALPDALPQHLPIGIEHDSARWHSPREGPAASRPENWPATARWRGAPPAPAPPVRVGRLQPGRDQRIAGRDQPGPRRAVEPGQLRLGRRQGLRRHFGHLGKAIDQGIE